jgi:hypothetical protein
MHRREAGVDAGVRAAKSCKAAAKAAARSPSATIGRQHAVPTDLVDGHLRACIAPVGFELHGSGRSVSIGS